MNEATGDWRATQFNRPTAVRIPSLGLLVKYGADVTRSEIETQIFLHQQLRDHHVPIPEVFGYAEENDQRFIYMALVQRDNYPATTICQIDRNGTTDAVCRA